MYNLRTCISCGAQFRGSNDQTKCPECVKKVRASTLRPRVCRACGKNFVGGPRAFYCPDCRAERQKAQGREYKQRKKAGAVRSLGSTAICERCGNPYTVAGGLQRYCPECAPEVIRETKNKLSRDWNEKNNFYGKRSHARKDSRTAIPCVICGKPFVPLSVAVTCSPECRAELQKRNFARWEKKNRDVRNAYQRNRHQKNIDKAED